jgi:hypothetical protein
MVDTEMEPNWPLAEIGRVTDWLTFCVSEDAIVLFALKILVPGG